MLRDAECSYVGEWREDAESGRSQMAAAGTKPPMCARGVGIPNRTSVVVTWTCRERGKRRLSGRLDKEHGLMKTNTVAIGVIMIQEVLRIERG